MKTLLLLAGRSTRFWPLEDKTLFPVCGKTLLEHQIDRLKQGGCEDITIIGGAHNLQAAKELIPEAHFVEQKDLDLGMRGALLDALPSCGDEAVLIVSGNDVIDPSAYKAVIDAAKKVDGGALLAQEVTSYFPGGYLVVDDEKVTGIIEKPGEGKEPSNLVNIVAHVHNNAATLLDALGNVDESTDDGYEQAVQKLLHDKNYNAVPYIGVWQAVKYPWHMLQLLEVLLCDIAEQKIDPSAEIHSSAVIDGPVVIEAGVKVLPHATIRGPAYIGKNSIVANNALVRNSSVGENCVVGYNTEVKGTVLHSDVWTHMTYLGDSIVGRNVSFGGGCVTGNLRLDEGTINSVIKGDVVDSKLTKFGCVIASHVRLGIQVGLNPGVKIGTNTFIAGGTFVKEDVPDNSFVCMKGGEMTRKENRDTVQDPTARDQYKQSVQKSDSAL